MNTAALKALADQCICHPASRGIADIEAAGEGLKHLIAQLEQMTADRDSWAQQASDRVDDAVKFAAQLEDAQGEIRRLAQVERELLALRASLVEPVGHVTPETVKLLKEFDQDDWCAIWNRSTEKLSVPLYAIKEVK